MERIAAFLAENNAQLWINHDKAQSDAIPTHPTTSNRALISGDRWPASATDS